MGRRRIKTKYIGSAMAACVLGLSLTLPMPAWASELGDTLDAIQTIEGELSQNDDDVTGDTGNVDDTVSGGDTESATTEGDTGKVNDGTELTGDEGAAIIADLTDDNDGDAATTPTEGDGVDGDTTPAESPAEGDTKPAADATANTELPAEGEAAQVTEAVIEAEVSPNSWSYEGGSYYFYDENGNKKTGWLVWDKTPQGSTSAGLQRYWLDSSTGALALSRLLSDTETGEFWAYARPEGYVTRGKYSAADGKIYLANNDGRLENVGWLVSNAYGDGLQRYFIEAASHAAEYTGAYASTGWDHVTTSAGYVARGKTTVNGRTYLANNEGKLENTGWVVSNAYDGGWQRYYVDATTHALEAYTGNYSSAGYNHLTTKEGYVLRGKTTVNGKIFLANNDGKLEEPGWLVTNAYDGSWQRYWIDATAHAAVPGFSNDGWAHYTTNNGYVLRGKYTSAAKNIYLANNDGKLEGPGWVISSAYGDGLQRYYIDATLHAAVPGFSTDGWAHYTTSEGYVLRGTLQADGKVYLANNDGEVANNYTGWIVTNVYDGTWQRYYLVTDGMTSVSYPVTGFFNQVLGSYGNSWFYGNPSKGYVVRGKYAVANGVLLADNDGLLVENKRGAGWYIGNGYDGETQRYYLVSTDGHVYAKTGHFVVNSKHYYGNNTEGYCVRGKLKVSDTVMVIANNNGVLLWQDSDGWAITNAYDSDYQRYYLVKSGDLMGARLGQFSVGGYSYFGRYDEGYVVRGLYNTKDGQFYQANNNGILNLSKNFTLLKRSYSRIKDATSKTQYLITTDCDNCYTYVYQRINGYWQILFEWLCGTGLPEYNDGQGTIRGTWEIGGNNSCYNAAEEGTPGYVPGGYRVYYYPKDDIYWVSCFCLDAAYHSTIPSMGSAESQIGRKVSHGCIRLLVQNAEWIYKNCAIGTRVITY